MVALQIRDVPKDVRDTLMHRARARGQSLQAFLLSLVKEEARRSRNVGLLQRFEDRTDGSRLTADEALLALDEARAEREAQLGLEPRPRPGGAG